MKKGKIINLIVLIMNIVLSCYCTYTVFKYAGVLSAIIAGLVLAAIIGFLAMLYKKNKKSSLVLSIVLVVTLLIGSYGAIKINGALSKITSIGEYETVQIVALKDSDITKDSDFSKFKLAYVNSDNGAYEKSSEILKENNKKVHNSTPYKDTKTAYKELKSKKVELMVLTNMTKSDLSSINEDYTDEIKVIFEKKYPMKDVTLKPVDISKEPFTLYLCGADLSSGDNINSTGRGDVNILLTINPNTKKVNLQAIPRDTFVEIPSVGGRSKLSYSGWWGGVQSSIASIEDKFDIDINYYAKLNFNGITELVDALGGVEVNSHYTYKAYRYTFTKGKNYVDGKKALAFARARKMLPENELSRGQHQMELIKGIFKKFAENPNFEDAMKIIDGLSDNFSTSLPRKDFVKAFNLVVDLLPQLETMENHSVKGEYKWHYDEVRTANYLYYYYPKESEINRVKNDIEKIISGK